MNDKFYINKVAVLGSGVMGSQIAAHFSNARINVVLFDLKSNEGKPNLIIEKSLLNLQKQKPSPLFSNKSLDYITVANYDDNLAELKNCDLIIEAIAERIDYKENLYKKIEPFVNANTILATNTSGLSITTLANVLPERLRSCFCGIHFFNPPRYMPLVEIIPSPSIGINVLAALESFLVSSLGKSVIFAKDTPNFIANRVGTFSLLVTAHYAAKFAIPFEVVDELTGKNLGRAKSATFRTADVVGLDVFAHVVETMANDCSDDSFASIYNLPEWINRLIANGCLGAKTRAGIYTKDKDGIKVIDITHGEYRSADKKASIDILEILKGKNWAIKFEQLIESKTPESEFLLACFCNLFHYVAIMLGEISDSPRDIDLSLRFGFGWMEGAFEIWQQMGWQKVAKWIALEIKSGNTISSKELPQWVFTLDNGVYADNKYYAVKENKYIARVIPKVYQKQLFPDCVLNETVNLKKEVLFENDGVILWHSGDDIGILSFKSKMCTIGSQVLDGISIAIDIAEDKCLGMVIWQQQDIFSAGANLEEFGRAIMAEGIAGIDKIITYGHNIIAKKIRSSKIPIIAAVKGYAFGGGCELMLHCDGVVAACESYIGLVEAGVGLIPGWGGSTEMAYRASMESDSWHDFEKRYKTLALAKVSSSAIEALELGFLKDSDTIVMNSKEILYIAKEKAKFMALAGYRPDLPQKFKVFGKYGIANIKGFLVNMLSGNQISEHDNLIANSLATIMCGGEIEKDSKVSQDWLLNLEKEMFKMLAINPKSQARIQHMLRTGKPLRN